MSDVIVTAADMDELASSLEAMADRFTPTQWAALHALFALAGAAIAAEEAPAVRDAVTAEVEGFAVTGPPGSADGTVGWSLSADQLGAPGTFAGLLRGGGAAGRRGTKSSIDPAFMRRLRL